MGALSAGCVAVPPPPLFVYIFMYVPYVYIIGARGIFSGIHTRFVVKICVVLKIVKITLSFFM